MIKKFIFKKEIVSSSLALFLSISLIFNSTVLVYPQEAHNGNNNVEPTPLIEEETPDEEVEIDEPIIEKEEIEEVEEPVEESIEAPAEEEVQEEPIAQKQKEVEEPNDTDILFFVEEVVDAEDDEYSGYETPRRAIVNAEPIKRTVTLLQTENGSISGTKNGEDIVSGNTYEGTGDFVFTATPLLPYTAGEWSVTQSGESIDCEEGNTGNTCTIRDITGDITVSRTFTLVKTQVEISNFEYNGGADIFVTSDLIRPTTPATAVNEGGSVEYTGVITYSTADSTCTVGRGGLLASISIGECTITASAPEDTTRLANTKSITVNIVREEIQVTAAVYPSTATALDGEIEFISGATVSSYRNGYNGIITYSTDSDISICEVDTTTGGTTAIGGGFRNEENEPRSIISHNDGKLYMVGWDSDTLYELNTTTGAATAVGGSFPENNVTSITSHNGKLYIVGWGSTLYELNTTTGAATAIGSDFTDEEDIPTSITSHNGKLYMVGSISNTLYELDTTTGAATAVGGTFVAKEAFATSITSHNGKLYLVGTRSDTLYELNTTTGAATAVGSTFTDEEHTARSITSHNGKLYMVGVGSRTLYRLNTTTGAATAIGSTFIDEEALPLEITSHNGKLYLVGPNSDTLYELNTTTGDITVNGAGSCEITATASQTDRYNGSSATSTPVVISKATSSIASITHSPFIFNTDGTPGAKTTLQIRLTEGDETRDYVFGGEDERSFSYTSFSTTATNGVTCAFDINTGVITIAGELPESDTSICNFEGIVIGASNKAEEATYRDQSFDITESKEVIELSSFSYGFSDTPATRAPFRPTSTPEVINTSNSERLDAYYTDGGVIEYSVVDSSVCTVDIDTAEVTILRGGEDASGQNAVNCTIKATARSTNRFIEAESIVSILILKLDTTADISYSELKYIYDSTEVGITLNLNEGDNSREYDFPGTDRPITIGNITSFDPGTTCIFNERFGAIRIYGDLPEETNPVTLACTFDITIEPTPKLKGTTVSAGVVANKITASITAPTYPASVSALDRIINPVNIASVTPSGYDGTIIYSTNSDISICEVNTTDIAPTAIGSPFTAQEDSPYSTTSHNGKLYMIGSLSRTLHELDTTTGAAIAVGSDFTAIEGAPRSITSHNGKLYMVGDVTHTLYELDTTTGAPTAIGVSFAAKEDIPIAITSHNGKLYLIGERSDTLYELDTTTGEATAIGSPFTAKEDLPRSFTSHNGKLYMVGQSSDTIYELNTTTGAATAITGSFTAKEDNPTSITSHNEKLYMVGRNSDTLYELNTTTGTVTAIGSPFTAKEGVPFSITSHNEKLYMVGHTSNILYELNTIIGGITVNGAGSCEIIVTAPQTDRYTGSSATSSPVVISKATSSIASITHSPFIFSTDGTPGAKTTLQIRLTEGGETRDYVFGGEDERSFSYTSFSTTATNGVTCAFDINTGVITIAGELPESDASICNFEGIVIGASNKVEEATYRDRSFNITGSKEVLDLSSFSYGFSDTPATRAPFRPTSTPERLDAYYADGGVIEYSVVDSSVCTVDTDTAEVTILRGGEDASGQNAVNCTIKATARSTNRFIEAESIVSILILKLDTTADISYSELKYIYASTEVGITLNLNEGDNSREYNFPGTDRPITIGNITSFDPGTICRFDKRFSAIRISGDLPEETNPVTLACTFDITIEPTPKLKGTTVSVGVVANKITASITAPTYPASVSALDRIINPVTIASVTPSGYDGTITYSTNSDISICEVNTTDTAATAIGASFAAKENFPRSITSHGGKLYMVGTDSDTLHELNTTTGVATAIGSGFTDQEDLPRSITSHNGKLYMVGERSNILYELNTITGVATAIGSGFAAKENYPLSITSHDGKLYMLGSGSHTLFELNTTTGVATAIGSSFKFQEPFPRSITSHGGKLYMVGTDSDTLYEINTTTGTVTAIGSSFTGQENFPTSITSHNGKLYMVGVGSHTLFELNTTTGEATAIGSSFAAKEGFPRSITSHNGKLYMVGDRSHTLHELNTTAGVATAIGSSFTAQEDTPHSITSYNGKLYMLGRYSRILYELNTTTGVATAIGSPFTGQENFPRLITSHNGKLYMVGADPDTLFEVNTTTGTVTAIGSGFAAKERFPASITSHNGKLYMIGTDSDTLYELNTTTGEATAIGSSFTAQEDTPISITSHGGKLYMIGTDSDTLYELNTTTGVATAITSSFTAKEPFPASITSHGGKLYIVGIDSDRLFEVNTTTGTVTAIGSSFTAQEDTPVSITSHNGKLYMVGNGSNILFELNTITGYITVNGAGSCEIIVTSPQTDRYTGSSATSTPVVITREATTTTLTYPSTRRLGRETIIEQPTLAIIEAGISRTFDPNYKSRTVTFTEVANSDTNNYCEVDTNTGVVTVTADVNDDITCNVEVSIEESGTYTSATDDATVLTKRPHYTGTYTWNNENISVPLQNKDILPVNTIYTTAGQCTVDSGGDVTVTGAGTCTITIDTPTDDPVDLTIETAKGTLIITNPVYLQTLPVNAGETNLTTEASTPTTEYTGVITYSTSTDTICSVDATSGAVTPLLAGTCTITASFTEDSNWNARDSLAIDITVERVDNIVNFTYPEILHTGDTQTVSPTVTINSEDLATTSRTATFTEVANTDTNNYCTVDSSTGVITITGTITEISVTCEVEVSIDLDGIYLASTHQATLNISGLSTDFSGDGVANTTDSILFYAYALFTSIGFSQRNIEDVLETLLEKELDYSSPATPRLSDSKEDVYALLDNYAKTNATDFSGDGVTNTTDSILFYAYALFTSIGFSQRNIEDVLETLLEKELDYSSPQTPRLSDSKEDVYELMDRASR